MSAGGGGKVLRAAVFHCQKGKCGVSEGRGIVGLLTAGGSLGEIELFALRRAFSSDRVSAGETFTKNPRQ